MQFVNIKDKTLQSLLNSGCNLWIVDEVPAPTFSLNNDVIRIEAEAGDKIDDIFRKMIAYFGIEPHREHYKRGQQLQSILQQSSDNILIVSNAELMNKKVNFRKFVLLSEELAGVFLQGNVFDLGGLAQSEVSFVMRGMVGVHAQNV